jgi:hypothetical protein
MLQLLTAKPVLYVCNVAEDEAATGNAQSARVAEMAEAQGAAHVVISAKIEEEIAQLDPEEAEMFLTELGLDEAGLDRMIRAGYALLQLETYFTVGPKEARAWTIPMGTLAPAGRRRHPRRFRARLHPGRDDFLQTISSRSAANRPPRTRARCGSRARATRSRTATSCTSCSTPELAQAPRSITTIGTGLTATAMAMKV